MNDSTPRRAPRTPEAVLRKLREVSEGLGSTLFPALVSDAQYHQAQIQRRLELLRKPQPQVAFIASRGAGKSTLINAYANAWLQSTPPPPGSDRKSINHVAILPLGNGGTTPCEVVVRKGSHRVCVEPELVEETTALLAQLAESTYQSVRRDPDGAGVPDGEGGDTSDADNAEDEESGATPFLEPEVARVLRGIIELPDVRTPRRESGIKAAARAFVGTQAEFVQSVVTRANLPRRVRTEFVPDHTETNPDEVISKILRKLFNGSYPDQPMPRRVNLYLPTVPQTCGHALPLIDTLGLPAVAPRQRGPNPRVRMCSTRGAIRDLMKDPWTLIVLVSHFPNAPAPASDIVRESLDELAHFRDALIGRTAVAIVDSGIAGADANFESPDEERQAKIEVCTQQLALLTQGAGQPQLRTETDWAKRVFCVNVLENIGDFRSFLESRVKRMHQHHQEELDTAVAAGKTFLDSLADASRQERLRLIGEEFDRHVKVLCDDLQGPFEALASNIMRPMADDFHCHNASSLRSMILRRGSATRLELASLHESAFTRAVNDRLSKLIEAIGHKGATLRLDPRFNDAAGHQTIDAETTKRINTMESALTAFTTGVVKGTLDSLMRTDAPWDNCEIEWGNGIRDPRYRTRVANHFVRWGEVHSRQIVHAALTIEGAQALVQVFA